MPSFDEDIAAVSRIAAIPTILEVVCRTTGMRFAAVARVTEDRWIACEVRDEIDFGLKPGGELKIETTICNEIRQSAKRVVIDHVAQDEVYRAHATPALYGFQSYISVPIRRRNGEFFGTLCAIDPRPAKLNTNEIVGMFELFADLIGFHLDQQDRLERREAELVDAHQLAELREQFIAVLGHDLRNPLASIDAGVQLIRRTPLNEKAQTTLALMENSVQRMARLIDNVLDLARGRLGGGLVLQPQTAADLRPMFEQVLSEFRLSAPGRAVEAELDLAQPVRCDPARIAQLLSNLFSNALTHGAADSPVRVRAVSGPTHFELSVANRGAPIPPATAARLFQPFFRASERGHQGLGLGLFIANEIARGHGGAIDVRSDADGTQFTFRMPKS